jgi:hypothetical protein
MLTACSSNTRVPMTQDEGARGLPALVLWSIPVSPNIDHSARFAAYPPGIVIYRPEDRGSEVPRYMQARVSPAQYEQWVGPERLTVLGALEESYFVSDAIGVPDNILQWRTSDNRVRQRVVTGALGKRAIVERGRTPSAFLSMFDAMAFFESPDAKPYVPEAVEVMLDRSRSDDAIPWPSEWPEPSPVRGSTDNASREEHLVAVFPGSRFEEVFKWVSEHHKAGRLVSYKGQIYVAFVRAVLPGNPTVLSTAEANAP